MSLSIGRAFASFAVLALVACGGAPPDEPRASAAGSRAAPQDVATPCGDQVARVGEALLVTPSGGEDTAALQCALDQGGTVRLAPGVFRIAQVVTNGFVGHLVGAGEGQTTVTNVDRPLQVAALNWNEAPPSAANPWPALLTFADSWFGVSQLTVQVTGVAPTTFWETRILGGGTHMFSAINVTGTAAAAVIEHVTIRGEEAPQVPVYGMNLLNAIDAQKFLGADPLPLSLHLTVRDSTFEKLASGVPVANLRATDVSIVGNRFDGTLLASEIIDLANSRYRFADNVARTIWAAIDQYDGCLGPSASCGLDRSSILIAGNLISGGPVVLEGTFNEDVRCRVVGNTFGEMGGVALPPEVDVYLGEGTHDCLVTGAANVQDLGTNNHVRP